MLATPEHSQDTTSTASPQVPLGLYIHVPFCLKRCSYCDFFTMPLGEQRDAQFSPYLDAVHRELADQAPEMAGPSLRSIFLGGGTPSLLHPEELDALFQEVRRYFTWDEDIEVTLEVNPETLDRRKAEAFRKVGVNRVSMGVQAMDPLALKVLGRTHDVHTARRCFDAVREAGFTNVSLDLIYGRPGQSVEDWQRDLAEVLTWQPEHFSMYELILEPGTPMTRSVKRGELVLPPDDDRLAMYRLARDMTREQGMEWYETSNYAKPGHYARHNLDNWLGAAYLGIGPGAHSFRARPGFGARRANPRNMPKYLEQPQAAPWKAREPVDACIDAMLNGLRVRQGFAPDLLLHQYGIDLNSLLKTRLRDLQEEAYLIVEPERWRVTERGAELLDSVVGYLSTPLLDQPSLVTSNLSK